MKPTLRNFRITPLLVICCLLVAATVSRAGVIETYDKVFNVDPGGTLYIESDLGSIFIETNSANEVKAEVVVKLNSRSERKIEDVLEDLNVDFEQDGSNVTVFVEYDKRRSWSIWGNSDRGLGIEISVSVPEKYNVDVFTAGGSIEIDDISGEVLAETSGGSLDFKGINGLVEAKTSGGSISLESCTGDVDVKTSGGSISIGEVKGDVQAHTSGGSIQVDEVMGILEASTSGGSITATIEGQPEDDCRLTTSGGSVTVYLDRNISIDIDAKTSAGRVETDFPVSISGKVRKSSMRGKINDGGPEMYLRTSAGNIRIYEI